MKRSYPHHLVLLIILLVSILALPGCNSSKPPATDSRPSTAGEQLDGKFLMEQRCSVCHTTGRITSKSATLDEWTITVDRMIGKGAQLDTAEKQTLIDFLVQNNP